MRWSWFLIFGLIGIALSVSCGTNPIAPALPTTNASVNPSPAPIVSGPMSVVVVLADDLRLDDVDVLKQHVPAVNRTLEGWIEFPMTYSPTHLCCPSRVSILTGLFEHNHHVNGNDAPKGGLAGAKRYGHWDNNIAVRLQSAGVRTIHTGKFLNEMGADDRAPGFDAWHGISIGLPGISYPGSEQVDEQTDQAVQFIRETPGQFFAYLNPTPPHLPHTPAPRHKGVLRGVPFNLPPSYNEADNSDKPKDVRNLSRLSPVQENDIVDEREERLESSIILFEMLDAIVAELSKTDRLKNTVIIFTSDNGWFYGEHRYDVGKAGPYEEATHMPLFVRVPGVSGGRRNHLVTLVDLAPTILELAGLPVTEEMDGQSLVPLFSNTPPAPTSWRKAVLWEGIPWFKAIRSVGQNHDYVYIQWYDGTEEELYNMKTDAYQLDNLIYYNRENSVSLPPEWPEIRDEFAKLMDCYGKSCRE